jgi:adenylate cyclase, class 2
MPYEVEIKYLVSDLAGVRRTCESLAGAAPETRAEVDTYLRHPIRSFEQTDEALRVRQANAYLAITYKGPKVDAATKTRVEIELQLVPGQYTSENVLDFWGRLGFAPVRQVRKDRELFRIPWLGREVHASLDHVHGLGDFVELELSAEPSQLEESRQILKSLAAKLGLQKSERKSYLELLLENDAASADKAKNVEDWAE